MADSSQTSVWNCDGEVIHDSEVFIRFGLTHEPMSHDTHCYYYCYQTILLKLLYFSFYRQITQTSNQRLSSWSL